MRPENLSLLIQDQFGNYVIQNALKHLSNELKLRFIQSLMDFLELIKQMPWGLQVISKMCSDSSTPAVMPTENLSASSSSSAT